MQLKCPACPFFSWFGTTLTLVYVRYMSEIMRTQKLGVPVACHVLCNYMPMELPGKGTKQPATSFCAICWQSLGCAPETPIMFQLA